MFFVNEHNQRGQTCDHQADVFSERLATNLCTMNQFKWLSEIKGSLLFNMHPVHLRGDAFLVATCRDLGRQF